MRGGLGGFRRSLLVAAAVHVAAVAWFAHRPLPAPVVASAPPDASEAVEVDVTDVAPTDEPRPETAEPRPAAERETTDARLAMAARTTEGRPSSATIEAAPTGSTEIVTGPPERATDWVVNPTGKIDLSVPRSAFARGGVFEAPPASARPADPSAPAPLSTTGGLLEGLDAHDSALGLGRSGPVLGAVDAAAHDPAAPVLGTAVFAVSVLEGGKVHVSVLNANGERTSWEKLGPIIAKNLEGKVVKTVGKGLRVTVRIDASERFPGGAPPVADKDQGAHVDASPGKLHETKDHHLIIELPHAGFRYVTRKCGVAVDVNPGGLSASGGCAPGVAMRVVETTLVSEERL